jgi:hypothetical protein
MGDYEVKDNSLMNQNSGVPTFKGSKNNINIKHREYLGDITGSTAFAVASYSLNPGSSVTFPWLSTVARSFAQYKFNGVLFEFVSTSADSLNSTNTALGTVVMATQYNASLPLFLNKQEMEEYEYSCSSRPSKTLIHPVECSPADTPLEHLYVRGGSLPSGQDIRFYDLGNFQIATVGMQAAADIGELWVTYDVDLLKPRIQPGGVAPGSFTNIGNGPYTAASNVLGTLQTTPVGTLGVTVSSVTTGWDSILFPSSITQGRFLVTVLWEGSGTAATTLNYPTLSNLTLQAQLFDGQTASERFCPAGGVTTALQQFTALYTINGYNVNGSTITFPSNMTLPATPTNVTIEVVPISLDNNYV